MKFRGANVLPPSIALWLEQQLELRGIDSVVYTRYILSLLNDETFDLNDLTTYKKGNKKLSSWKSCNLEELKRSAVIQCLTEAAEQAFEIESLVDELCVKLKEADSEVSGGKCLKEKTNSEDIFNLDLSVSSLDLANKYYSAFPALSKGNSFENTFPLTSVWSRNICRALGGGRRRVDSESSTKDNKVSKRKENKENVLCGLNGGARRMRSRSTVKQSSGHHRNRASAAKSLDRKEDEISTAMKRTYCATKTVSSDDVDCGSSGSFSGGGDSRGRKCLSFMHNSLGQLIGYPVSRPAVDEQIPRRRDDKLSRTPGRRGSGGDNVGGVPKVDLITTDNYDSDELPPVDFQQLLTSPSDYSLESSLYKQHQSYPQSTGALSGNFIQCGTNITSSIWSDTSEKMEEDENGGSSGNWETVCGSGINGNAIVGGSSKWSDARGSILSSAWKLPFVYDKDIEGTSLAVNASSGSFYSFFDSNPISSSYLAQNNRNTSEVGENKVEGLVGDTLRSDGEQEEDLLTSMRTHFRPIRNSDIGNCTGGPTTAPTAEDGCIKGGTAGAGKVGVYKNGSTFTDNSASPIKVDFKRSESGALYLITGEKYFEFKRSSPNCLPHPTPQEPQQQLSSTETASSSTFVPKFKVRQNEKFCQTDISPSTPSESDFFFPGDDHLAEEMLNNCCDDVDEDDDDDDVVDEEGEVTEESDEWFEGRRSTVNGETRQAIQVSGWVTAWPVALDSNAAIWASAADNSNAKAWVCNNNGGGARYVDPTCLEDRRMDDRNEHYLRLRDELSEEGEELLSDLSSIHLFLDPERMDEPNPHIQKALMAQSGGA